MKNIEHIIYKNIQLYRKKETNNLCLNFLNDGNSKLDMSIKLPGNIIKINKNGNKLFFVDGSDKEIRFTNMWNHKSFFILANKRKYHYLTKVRGSNLKVYLKLGFSKSFTDDLYLFWPYGNSYNDTSSVCKGNVDVGIDGSDWLYGISNNDLSVISYFKKEYVKDIYDNFDIVKDHIFMNNSRGVHSVDEETFYKIFKHGTPNVIKRMYNWMFLQFIDFDKDFVLSKSQNKVFTFEDISC